MKATTNHRWTISSEMSELSSLKTLEAADQDPRPSYVIGICTRNRADLLDRLVTSIGKLEVPDQIRLSLIILDNNEVLQTAAADFDLPATIDVFVEHEPKAGLVFARNALFAAAQARTADWLLGIDDDVWLAPDWLVEWHRGLQNTGSGIMVGTTTFVYQDDLHPLHPRSQFPEPVVGKRPPILGTSNYAVHRFVFDSSTGLGLRFDARFNHCGGEDSEFMLRAIRQHEVKVTGWPSARVFETRSGGRTAMRYELWRGIRNQVNLFHIAARHRELGISSIWQSVPIVVLKCFNRNLVFGTGLLALSLIKFIGLRKDAGATLGLALRRFARLGAVVPFIKGTSYNEYGVGNPKPGQQT